MCLLLTAITHAQDFRRWRGMPLAQADSFDGAFNYCRVMYKQQRFGDGGGWTTDYPNADLNLSTRLGELTMTPVSRDSAGEPKHLIVRPTDEEFFRCPFLMMQEVGRLYLDDVDAVRLREHLLKGGFLWVDDFWGERAWDIWSQEIGKAFPPGQYPILDIPRSHLIYRALFDLDRVPQIPSINFWYGTGGGTSERGADSAEVHARGIFDDHGRLMVLMTHNTDVSDSWEREGEDPRYFREFSVNGYQVAMNVLITAMTQ
jgi:hypothetical protein